MPNAPFKRLQPSTGNGCALIVCDSRFEEFFQLYETVFAALGHFGIPYRLHDLAKADLKAAELRTCAVVILAQDNLGLAMTRQSQSCLLAAVAGGLGLVNLDYNLSHYDASLVEAAGVAGLRSGRLVDVGSATSVCVPDANHWLTWTQEEGEEHRFNMPIPAALTKTRPWLITAARASTAMGPSSK